VFLRKGMLGTAPKSPFPGMEPFGVVPGSDQSSLKAFLEGISGRTSYSIYLALPRALFFARNIRLPMLHPEDALLSVQNSLMRYCHLPLEEIYYDVHFSSMKNGMNALLFYASRRKIDPYLGVFDETGMRPFLKGVFPVSYGVYAWLALQRYPRPLGLILPADDTACELAYYGEEGFLYSGMSPHVDNHPDAISFPDDLGDESTGLEGNVFWMGHGGGPVLPPPQKNRLGRTPLPAKNMGVAAVSPPLSGKQEISLDGTPTRLKYFRPAKVVIPLIVALALGMGLFTWQADRENARKTRELVALKEQVAHLRKRIQPLQRDLEALKKSSQFMNNIDAFMESRPNLYTVLNKVAELVPDGTWFSNCSFERGVITLRGTSSDAVKVLETLRKSGLFTQVKLLGSVSRQRTGQERFGLSLEVK
jgi:Tfp pilus assembly protein PilN